MIIKVDILAGSMDLPLIMVDAFSPRMEGCDIHFKDGTELFVLNKFGPEKGQRHRSLQELMEGRRASEWPRRRGKVRKSHTTTYH